MSKPEIVGITVSIDISDKNYGSGTTSFLNLQGRYPDPAALEDTLTDGLDMYFAAWKSLLAGRYATGAMTAVELKKALEEATVRVDKVKNFLAREHTNG